MNSIKIEQKSYFEEQKCSEFIMCNRMNMIFSDLGRQSKLYELRGLKVIPVILHKFYHLSSLQHFLFL